MNMETDMDIMVGNRKKMNNEKVKIYESLKEVIIEIKVNILAPLDIEKMVYTVKLAKVLGISEQQLILFAWVYFKGEDNRFAVESEINQLFRFLLNADSREVRSMLRSLTKENFISQYDDRNLLCYHIPQQTMKAIDENNVIFFNELNPCGLENSLNVFYKRGLNYQRISEREAEELVFKMTYNNREIDLIKYVNEHFLYCENESAFLLFAICSKALIDNDSFNFGYMIQYVEYSKNQYSQLRKDIHLGRWWPIKHGLVEVDVEKTLKLTPFRRSKLTPLRRSKLTPLELC
jgi:hypothetical protein